MFSTFLAVGTLLVYAVFLSAMMVIISDIVFGTSTKKLVRYRVIAWISFAILCAISGGLLLFMAVNSVTHG